MANNLNELLQEYVDKPYDELLTLARCCLSDLVGPLTACFGSKQDVTEVVMIVISACVGIDGKITGLENKFIGDLTGTHTDYTRVVAARNNEMSRKLTDAMVDTMDNHSRTCLTAFCLCFLAVDKTISREEVAFIQRLIG